MALQSLPRFSSRKLLHRLRSIAGGSEPVPTGFLTTKAWAKKWSISDVRASHMLFEGVKAGAVVMKKFRVARNGVVRPVPHYAAK